MSYKLTIRESGHSWAGRSPIESVHPTLAAAEAELLDYVRRNWETEIGTVLPNDSADLVTEYFADVLESYDIREDGQDAAGSA